MIDARSTFTPVSSTINEFSPEQESNLLAINWLYKEEISRYIALLENYISDAAAALNEIEPSLHGLDATIQQFLDSLDIFLACDIPESEEKTALVNHATDSRNSFKLLINTLNEVLGLSKKWFDSNEISVGMENEQLVNLSETLNPIAVRFKDLSELILGMNRKLSRIHYMAEKSLNAKSYDEWDKDSMKAGLVSVGAFIESTSLAVDALLNPLSHAKWLVEQFPDATYQDVLGLCKVASLDDLKLQDYSLSPGRYVGVAPLPIEDEEVVISRLRDIHSELTSFNEAASTLADEIEIKFKELVE